MNSGNLVVKRPLPWSLRWSTWLLTMFSLVGIVIVWIGWREAIAYRGVQQELSFARAAGHPVDNDSLASRYEQRTSGELTQEWLEVMRLTSMESVAGKCEWLNRFLENIDESNHDFRDDFRLVLADFLEEAKPLVDRIKKMKHLDKPVRMPIRFAGHDTTFPHLFDSYYVFRLLLLEFEYALNTGDRERAMDCLNAIENVADALRWDFCSMASHSSQNVSWYRRVIRNSLGTPFWSKSDLELLSEKVSMGTVPKDTWREIMYGDLAMILDTEAFRSSDMGWNERTALVSLNVPSVKKYFLEQFRNQLKLADEGYDEIRNRAHQYELGRELNVYYILLSQVRFPVEHLALSLAREEMLRKLTKTAIALKRYRMDKGNWPNNLTRLTEFGLEPNDWMCTKEDLFMYKIESNTKPALLWGYDGSGKMVHYLDFPEGSHKGLDYVVEISPE